MSNYDDISKLVEELEPYASIMEDEHGELLHHLLATAKYFDYFSSDGFFDALCTELSTIKMELEENYEIAEEEVTVTQTYKTLVLK